MSDTTDDKDQLRKSLLKDIDELISDYEIGLDMSVDSFQIKELEPLEIATCPDCKGSGIYQGIGAPEDCQNCKGRGQV